MLPGLLKTLARNVGRAQADIGLYELGSVFLPAVGERPRPPSLGVDRRPTVEELKQLEATLPDQPLHLAVALSGQRPSPAGGVTARRPPGQTPSRPAGSWLVRSASSSR